jgi:thiamine kinase-like enzyme
LWTPEPKLIDWEYTRLGDPADEIAYTFDQNSLSDPQRRAFWAGYRRSAGTRSNVDDVMSRVNWWLPVTLLGSALWWAERFVRRTELDTHGGSDPALAREPEYYLGHVASRTRRLPALLENGL